MSYQLSIQSVMPIGMYVAFVDVNRCQNNINTPEIPPEETIFSLGREALESTNLGKWVRPTQSLSRAERSGDGAAWHGRISKHIKEDATFDEFWSKLGVNKAENEKYPFGRCTTRFHPVSMALRLVGHEAQTNAAQAGARATQNIRIIARRFARLAQLYVFPNLRIQLHTSHLQIPVVSAGNLQQMYGQKHSQVTTSSPALI
ncbi:hypothetical protein K503DRAFT_784230 [Rhizopogon vinicolor AM-OR11-026]|uniref:Uncharacterized protein n=1 Tax=Rhizopogon vinicolor AM-OR11-026 TaxID=1314800 RepID=A0A1B7MVG6_9AGAM|nr:hypothetical protein K503DRAFT_784230 [Rhizopogon vinicolor AM-OR11-026]